MKRMRDAGCGMRDEGMAKRDAGCRMQDAYAKAYRWKEQQRERRIELMERNEHYGTMEDIAAKEFERELVETMPNWFAEIMEEAVRTNSGSTGQEPA